MTTVNTKGADLPPFAFAPPAFGTLNVQQLFSIIANQMLHSIDVYMQQRETERGKERVRSQGGAGNLIMANVRLSGAHLVCLPAGHKERERERGEFAHKGVVERGKGQRSLPSALLT